MSKLAYLAIGILVFVGFITVMAPANTLYRLAADDIAGNLPDTSVTDISGSLWGGSGLVHHRQFPAIRLDWSLSPLRLVTGAAGTDITATALGLEAAVEGVFRINSGEVSSIRAKMSQDFLNPITVPYGLDLSGEVQLSDASLGFDQRWLNHAAGQLEWTGGIVHIETPERIHTVKLPPLTGEIAMAGENLVIDVTESGQSMMKILLKPDGWAVVTVTYAFADLADLPLPGTNTTSNRSQPAITLEEKIL